jgi:Cu(I)/Ag(I) efflux system membrane fusion protein
MTPPPVRLALAGAAVVAALGIGYGMGRTSTSAPAVATPSAVPATATKAVAYYQDPSGKPDFSPVPKTDDQGRAYLPVYAEEQAETAATPPPAPKQGRILYYRNPMGLPDTSPVPKKDPMGMDYVPVREGDEDDDAGVRISPDKVQTLGVKTVPAEMRRLTHTVRAAGTVQVDERRQYLVTPKFEGYAETLRVNATGQTVRRGQPLMEVYSPDLVLAQEEYLAAVTGMRGLDARADADAREAAARLVQGALQRLRNWDIPAAELARLQTRGTPSRTLSLPSPASGVVLDKTVIAGQRFLPGEVLYKIADLADVWLIGDVHEQDLPFLHVGQTARATFSAMPGETFVGTVTFIYPTLTAETRTVKVRIELPNPDGRLKPALYGAVDIEAPATERATLAVPDSALLDSGTAKVVLVDRGGGRFAPRDVTTGARADGYVEILDGLSAGDVVVVSANFLIDAESNLRAALHSFHHP